MPVHLVPVYRCGAKHRGYTNLSLREHVANLPHANTDIGLYLLVESTSGCNPLS